MPVAWKQQDDMIVVCQKKKIGHKTIFDWWEVV